MFKKETFSLGPHEGITLGCEALGTGISFIPDHGGTITTLKLVAEGAVKSVLDPISSYNELINNKEFKNIWLAPFPNRVADGKYSFNDKAYQLPKNEAGDINALHGFIFKRKFELTSVKCLVDRASVVLVDKYDGDYPGYPFPFVCTIFYQVFADSFITEITIENTGSSEMPIGMGWHPYFRLQSTINQTELTLPDAISFKQNQYGIPSNQTETFDTFVDGETIGTNQFDNCLYLNGQNELFKSILYDSATKMELELWQDANYEFLQVFTPPHRKSIAIEPMTCAADAYNNKIGLKTLKPGESMNAKCGVQLAKRSVRQRQRVSVAEYFN